MKSSSPSAELAVAQPRVANVWDDVRLQKLWLGLERCEWRSLAVLGVSASSRVVEIAELLAQLAWRYRGHPSDVCDLRALSLRLVDYELREMRAMVDSGTRVVAALQPIFENPTSAVIAKHCDAALLCITLGESTMKAADETITAVGRAKVIGTIVLRPPKTNKLVKRKGGT